MSSCLQLCKHSLTLYSTLCEWNLAESQHWEMGVTNATKGNKTASLLIGETRKDKWDLKWKKKKNFMRKNEKFRVISRTENNNYSLLRRSRFIRYQIIDEMLAGSLTAPREQKYLRKWASSISWCWTGPPFLFYFPLRERMRGLIWRREIFAFRRIWPINLLNKWTVEERVQYKTRCTKKRTTYIKHCV